MEQVKGSNVRSAIAGERAIEAHTGYLSVEGDASAKLWQLLASLHEWSAEAGVDFDDELRDFRAELSAGRLNMPGAQRVYGQVAPPVDLGSAPPVKVQPQPAEDETAVVKTVLQFVVLHEQDDPPGQMGLVEIARECNTGGYVGGALVVVSSEPLSLERLTSEAEALGSSADFFGADCAQRSADRQG